MNAIERFPSSREIDILPNGAGARLVWDSHIETDKGAVPLPGENVAYLVCMAVNGALVIAGQGHGTGRCWVWRSGLWTDHGAAFGVSPVAFDHLGHRLWVCRGGDVASVYELATMHRTDQPLVTGSQGIRFVSWDGRVITCDDSHRSGQLFDFTDWGDCAVGQLDDGVGVRFADDGVTRRLSVGDAWRIMWERTNDDVAISWADRVTAEACSWTGTMADLRELPAVAIPAPQPPPVEPPPAPAVPELLRSQDGRFRLVMQNDGNVVVYGPDSVLGLGRVWPWFVPEPTPEPIPTPEPGPMGRLRVDGRKMLRADGSPFVWRGVTAFRLVEMIEGGAEAEAESFMRWAGNTGFNVVRVLTMCNGMFRLTPEQGRSDLPYLLTVAAEYGLYVHVVCLADTASYPDMCYGAHVEAVGRICAERSNVALVECSNEPGHSTQAAAVHDVANLEAWASRVPGIVPVALGASADDESVEMKAASAITVHLDRGRDEFNMCRRVRELENVSAYSGRYVVNSEPIGAAEQNEPGRRNSNHSIHYTFGALSRVFNVGSTFHLEAGLHCTIPGPVQQACAEAFIAGTQIVPDGVTLRFYNAGWADSPVLSARFAEGPPKPDACVRAYSGVYGDQGVVVALGVLGDPGIVYGAGWGVGAVVASMPGVQALRIQKG